MSTYLLQKYARKLSSTQFLLYLDDKIYGPYDLKEINDFIEKIYNHIILKLNLRKYNYGPSNFPDGFLALSFWIKRKETSGEIRKIRKTSIIVGYSRTISYILDRMKEELERKFEENGKKCEVRIERTSRGYLLYLYSK